MGAATEHKGQDTWGIERCKKVIFKASKIVKHYKRNEEVDIERRHEM